MTNNNKIMNKNGGGYEQKLKRFFIAIIKRCSKWLVLLLYTIQGISRIVRFAEWKKLPQAKSNRSLAILANGPSLKAYQQKLDIFADKDVLCLNFFALTDDFISLKPKYYALADPAFFVPRQDRLSEELTKIDDMLEIFQTKIDWQMHIIVPSHMAIPTEMAKVLHKNKNLSLIKINEFYFEGFSLVERYLRKKQLMSFIFQNVVVMAISAGMFMGYKNIFLFGVDADWIKNITVGSDNKLYLDDTHFYGTQKRVIEDINMEIEMKALYTTFRMYGKIAIFAKENRINIYNTCEHSFIDAFPKINMLEGF